VRQEPDGVKHSAGAASWAQLRTASVEGEVPQPGGQRAAARCHEGCSDVAGGDRVKTRCR
jgi:hypothetical protein